MHKKEILHDIDTRIEDASRGSLCHEQPGNSERTSPPLYANEPEIITGSERVNLSLKLERDAIHSSSRVERTPGIESPNRPRAGDPRIWSPKSTQIMAMSQENEMILLSQGALESPRDRQGGAPDATGSNVSGRESSEGTVGAASVSAPAAKTATAENDPIDVLNDYTVTPTVIVPEETPTQTTMITQATGEKRKASPGSEANDIEGAITRRPLKARMIESTESPEARSASKDDDLLGAEIVTSVSDAQTEADADVEISSPDNRVTRASKRKSDKMADFSQLTASRQRKINKVGRAEDKDGKDVKQTESKKKSRGSSAEFQEEFIESVVTRIQKADEESKLDVSSARSARRKLTASSRFHEEDEISSVASDYSERSSDSVIASSYCSSSKKVSKKNTSKRGAKDPTVKNPVQKPRRRKQIPIIVSKDEAERELQYTRKTWLDMDPATLGERCLEHLAELERQRSLCSNISGIVAGRMKDSGAIASEITRAMIEKLTTIGDVIGLRNQNFSLKEKLDEIKRREQAQCEEIRTLRKMISNLEREVRSLKEGFGPFPSIMPPPAQPEAKMRKKLSTPERRQEKEIRREDILLLPQRQEENLDMEVEPLLLNNTPGCSSNEDYMSRKLEWPSGREATPWSADAVEVRRATNTNNNNKAKFSTYPNTH